MCFSFSKFCNPELFLNISYSASLTYLWPCLRRTQSFWNHIPSSSSSSRCIPGLPVSFLPLIYLVGTNKKNKKKFKKRDSIPLVFWNHCVCWPSMHCNEGCCAEQELTRNKSGITSFSLSGAALGKEKQNGTARESLGQDVFLCLLAMMAKPWQPAQSLAFSIGRDLLPLLLCSTRWPRYHSSWGCSVSNQGHRNTGCT